MLHWNNVSAGYELFSGDTPELLEGGYAFAGVTTQRVGVHGLPTAPQGLQAWDPERYGSLSIASDDDSFDIFTQAARAVGPDRDRTTDPLGGLDVRRVIAMGSSQSAGRLGAYVNAIHPLARAIDAYLLLIYFGSGSPLEVGDEVVNIVNPAVPFDARAALRGRNLIRDDLDVPVMVVNSELEAIACLPVRQPDTDRFRYWESAGTCHVSQQSMDQRKPKYERDFGTPLPQPASVNGISMIPLYDAALHHVQEWLTTGAAPPQQPLIEFAGDPPDVVRDDHGIARGGIRLPQADVPIAQNSAIPVARPTSSACCTARACRSRPTRSAGSTATSPRTSPASRRRHAPPRRPGCCCPGTSRRSSTRLAPPTRPQPASPAPSTGCSPRCRWPARADHRDAACYNDEMAGQEGQVLATRRARIVTGVLMVLLVVVAAGTGLPSDIRDGVANGSDVAVRALVGGLAGAALGVGLLLGARRIGVADETRAGRRDGRVPRDPHDRRAGRNGERVDGTTAPRGAERRPRRVRRTGRSAARRDIERRRVGRGRPARLGRSGVGRDRHRGHGLPRVRCGPCLPGAEAAPTWTPGPAQPTRCGGGLRGRRRGGGR